jgi:hypothetical protein
MAVVLMLATSERGGSEDCGGSGMGKMEIMSAERG